MRGLPVRAGSLRRFQADSGAGSARDEKEAGGRYVKDIYDLQDFYGSDGTRTRDLRRDRPNRARRRLAASSCERYHLQGFMTREPPRHRMVDPIVQSTFGPRVGHEML